MWGLTPSGSLARALRFVPFAPYRIRPERNTCGLVYNSVDVITLCLFVI